MDRTSVHRGEAPVASGGWRRTSKHFGTFPFGRYRVVEGARQHAIARCSAGVSTLRAGSASADGGSGDAFETPGPVVRSRGGRDSEPPQVRGSLNEVR